MNQSNVEKEIKTISVGYRLQENFKDSHHSKSILDWPWCTCLIQKPEFDP